MKCFFLPLLIFSNALVLAQSPNSVLNGLVAELNSRSKPLYPVQVKADSATPTRTEQNGSFRLVFYKVLPGGKVKLSLYYDKDWVVVNERELVTRLPDRPSNEMIRLYMCTRQVLANKRAEFYNIVLKSYDDIYKRKIAQLKQNSSADRDSIKKLQEVIKQLKERTPEWEEKAENYARQNLDELSEVEKKALEEFKKGNIEQSIKILESAKPDEILEKLNNEKKKREQQLRIANDEFKEGQITARRIYLQNAQNYQLRFSWNEAELNYEKAAKVDTTNFDGAFAFATFLVDEHKYDKAENWCRVALNAAVLREDSAKALKLLGYLYQDKNNFDAAIQAYKQALNLFALKATENPNDFQVDYARTLLTMGTAFYDRNDYKTAEELYRKALLALEAYEKKHPGSVTEFVAAAYVNLGNLFLNQEELNRSEMSFRTGRQLLTQMLQTRKTKPDKRTDSLTNLSRLATIYNNLGILYRKKKNMAEARKNLDTAILIDQRLVAIDASAYELQLADSYMNLANLPKPRNTLSLNKDIGEQDSLLQLALAIYERLAASDPGVYEPRLARILHNLGQLYIDKTNAKGVAYYQKAIAINQRLAQKDPPAFEPQLADNYRSLGIFYGAKLIQMSLLGQTTSQKTIYDSVERAARVYINKAFDIYERHVKVNPDATEPGLAELYSFTAEMGDTTAAQKALEIYTRLAKRDPEAFEGELAEKYLQIGKSRLLHENYSTTTATALAEALRLYQQLAKKEPDVYEPSLAQAYSAISHFYSGKRLELFAKKSYDQAAMDSLNRQMLQAAEKQFQIWFRFVRQNPVVYEPQLAAAYMDIATAYSNFTSRENILAAKDAYQKALVIFEKYPDDMSSAERIKLIKFMLVYLEQQLKEEKQ